jgi:hypothetical protein
MGGRLNIPRNIRRGFDFARAHSKTFFTDTPQIVKPYYLWTPGYYNVCGGIKVMHRLCHELNEAGCRAYVNNPLVNPEWNTPVGERRDKVDFIAIYPEIILNNPFNAKHVVRYILYRQEKEYEPGEIIVPYNRAFNSLKLPEQRILYLPVLDHELFTDLKLPRKGRAFYVGKGAKSRRVPETEGLPEITPNMGHDQRVFANLFQRLELLYSYDNMTCLTDVARLCGCPVVIIGNGSFSMDQLENSETGVAGIGFGVEQTEYAMATIDSAAIHRRYDEAIRQFHVRLKLFIELTQTAFGKPRLETVLNWGNNERTVFKQ